MRISDWSSDVCSSDLKVPLFSAIPACPRQDTESPDDFLSGRVQRRVLNIPATGADCSNDGGKGALELARTRMDSIATKIRTRAALTAEERQFVANVSTLPVYRKIGRATCRESVCQYG